MSIEPYYHVLQTATPTGRRLRRSNIFRVIQKGQLRWKGTVTPDVRAPEGSRVSEVSVEGVRLGVSSDLTVEAHLVLITQLQNNTRASWKRPNCAYFVLTT